MEKNENVDPFEFIRVVAATRIMMPKSYIRLSAGRENMNDQTQAMCFMAGANSIFYGCKLLTSSNPKEEKDQKLFQKLNLFPDYKTKSITEENKNYENLKYLI